MNTPGANTDVDSRETRTSGLREAMNYGHSASNPFGPTVSGCRTIASHQCTSSNRSHMSHDFSPSSRTSTGRYHAKYEGKEGERQLQQANSNMDDLAEAMACKRMELRVVYMEALRAKGDEDALAEVALSVGELRAWLDEAAEKDDDRGRASAVLAVRHLRAMLSRRREREDAMQLSLELLDRLVTMNDVVQMAAETAITLHENDLKSMIGALIHRFGSAIGDGDSVRVWRLLLIVRFVIANSPQHLDFDTSLYCHFPVPDTMEELRLADIINSGLSSPIPACRMEAVRVLRVLAFVVCLSTAESIVEILLVAVDDENCDEGAQFIVANVWEVLFVRPQLAKREFSTLCLTASKPSIRQVSIHGALRHITLAQIVSDFEVTLLCFIVELYASGSEKDARCLELMYTFFDESLGTKQSHCLLIQQALIHMNREAYLNGVPLPSSRIVTTGASQQSQQGGTLSEAQLRRQNRLLISSLKATELNDLLSAMQRMLHDEFSTTYTRDRLINILGAKQTNN